MSDRDPISLSNDAGRALECLVRSCIERLREDIFDAPSKEVPSEVQNSDNLYALHVRYPGDSWKFKYVGISDNIRKRLQDHLAGSKSSSGPQSKYDHVRCEMAKGNTIGVSSITVRSSGDRADKALCKYVESRIIDWLRGNNQVKRFGKPWNSRG